MKPFIEKMRRLYRKQGEELKYLEVCEFGTKGGLHHHIILNRSDKVSTADVRKKWKFGRIHFNLMDDTGEYSKLASYLLKNRKYWRAAGGTGKQYSPSRNLDRPEPEKTIIKTADGYYEKPREKKGWNVAPGTEKYFTTEAGWPYMRYILVKKQQRRGP